MRLRHPIAVLAIGLALLTIAAPAFAADEEWEFDGGGWGHGVGLSQFGALGQAQDGRNSTQILQHYYAGTSVVEMPSHWSTAANGLWVGLVLERRPLSASRPVGGPLTICQPAAVCPPANGSGFTDVTIDPGESWVFESVGTGVCRFRKGTEGNLGAGPV